MASSFPDESERTPLHKEPEEAGEDNGYLDDIVSVDIYVCEERDDSHGAHPETPVPLPSPADRVEAARNGKVELPVLPEAGELQQEGGTEERCERDAKPGACPHRIHRCVAPCRVDEGAVRVEQRRRVRRVRQDAPRAIRQRPIAVQCVVPVVERC